MRFLEHAQSNVNVLNTRDWASAIKLASKICYYHKFKPIVMKVEVLDSEWMLLLNVYVKKMHAHKDWLRYWFGKNENAQKFLKHMDSEKS